MPKFSPGDPVTGAPGRVSHGWHGVVKEVVKPVRMYPEPGKSGVARDSYMTALGYRVHWREREESEDKLVAKNPILFMTEEQICEAIETQTGQTAPAEDRAEAWEAVEEGEDLTIGVF